MPEQNVFQLSVKQQNISVLDLNHEDKQDYKLVSLIESCGITINQFNDTPTYCHLAIIRLPDILTESICEAIKCQTSFASVTLIIIDEQKLFHSLESIIFETNENAVYICDYKDIQLHLPVLIENLLRYDPQHSLVRSVCPQLHHSLDIAQQLLLLKDEFVSLCKVDNVEFCFNYKNKIILNNSENNLDFSIRQYGLLGMLSYMQSPIDIHAEDMLPNGMLTDIDQYFIFPETILWSIPILVDNIHIGFVLMTTKNNTSIRKINIKDAHNVVCRYAEWLFIISNQIVADHKAKQLVDPNDFYRSEITKNSHLSELEFAVPIDYSASWAKRGLASLATLTIIMIILSVVLSVGRYAPGYGVINDEGIIPLFAPNSGIIQSINTHSKKSFLPGELLIVIANHQQNAELEAIQNQLNALVKKHLLKQAQPSDETNYRQLQARKSELQNSSGAFQVKSEFSGSVSEILVKAGDYVEVGQKVLFVTNNTSEKILRFAIPAHYLPYIDSGDTVSIQLPSLPDDIVTARVDKIYSQGLNLSNVISSLDIEQLGSIETANSYVLVEARFSEDLSISHERLLVSGYQGSVKLRIKSIPLIFRVFPKLEKIFEPTI